MRILIAIGGYLPAENYGGPVVSINNMCDMLKGLFEIYIVTVDHDINSSERFKNIDEGWNDYENASVLYLKENEISLKALKNIVKEISPDILYVNSLFLAKFTIPFQIISKLESIPLLIAPRGELCIQPYSTKNFKKKVYTFILRNILKSENVFYQSTSEEEHDQINKILNIEKEKIFSLDNIPSIPDINIKSIDKVQGTLQCVFLSRIHPKKNLDYILRILSKVQANINFDIYGNIEDVSYWEECKNIINKLPLNVSVNYKGSVKHEEVFETFSKYDVFLFPTKSENYGHVIVEAMLSGCLVVLSDQTPWTDINDFKAGWAIKLNEEEKFVRVIDDIANMNCIEYSEIVSSSQEYIRNKLNMDELKDSYIKTFLKIKTH